MLSYTCLTMLERYKEKLITDAHLVEYIKLGLVTDSEVAEIKKRKNEPLQKIDEILYLQAQVIELKFEKIMNGVM